MRRSRECEKLLRQRHRVLPETAINHVIEKEALKLKEIAHTGSKV